MEEGSGFTGAVIDTQAGRAPDPDGSEERWDPPTQTAGFVGGLRIPEPTTLVLFGTALLGFAGMLRARKQS